MITWTWGPNAEMSSTFSATASNETYFDKIERTGDAIVDSHLENDRDTQNDHETSLQDNAIQNETYLAINETINIQQDEDPVHKLGYIGTDKKQNTSSNRNLGM